MYNISSTASTGATYGAGALAYLGVVGAKNMIGGIAKSLPNIFPSVQLMTGGGNVTSLKINCMIC